MDFGTVRHRLENSLYCDPEAFARDIRLIFTNSRRYNTNPRSKVSYTNWKVNTAIQRFSFYTLFDKKHWGQTDCNLKLS